MKSALQLLVDAPDHEVRRMQIVYKAVSSGDWSEAWHHLSNITTTENSSRSEIAWVSDVHELADFCLQAKQVTRKSI